MSGETDNGLSFGASIDLEDATEQGNSVDVDGDGDFADFTVFVSGAFGTLTMGDTDGAMDWALTEAGNMGNGGSIADDETAHAGYLGSYLDGNEDGQILRYNYSVGAFGFAASAELDDTGAGDVASAAGALRNAFTSTGGSTDTVVSGVAFADSGDTSMALGLKYGMDLGGGSLTLGVAYQSAADRVAYIATRSDNASDVAQDNTIEVADTTAVGVSAVYAANGLTVGVNMTQYSDYAGVNAAVLSTAQAANEEADTNTGSLSDATHTSIGLGYTTGAVTLHANYGELDYDSAAIADVDGYGVSAAYDLGGGASAHLGFNDNDADANWSLGLAMSF